jgi:5-hydroxyisourate hydrolase
VTVLSTHVLNVAAGAPAVGVPVSLTLDGVVIGGGSTDADGRLRVSEDASPGTYVLTFDTGSLSEFYPSVSVTFVISPGVDRYHVPLLISPFGYTTYRGS